MGEIRTRFAPSPTGYLHVGNAHTALFNWLFARHHRGAVVLRIEDTDIARSRIDYQQCLLEDLRWLGIDWDEGPDIGGAHGPYRQSERLEIYPRFAQQLLEQGKAYYCYCTDEELALRRKEILDQGKVPHYDGRCRHLTPEQRQNLEAEGRQPAIRFLTPQREIVLKDLIRGEIIFPPGVVGDFVILRSDKRPVYNFAVVVDDALMKITHIIRAEEHLPNTVRQIMLWQALGFPLPHFAHLSLLLGKGRSKLSKREGAVSIREYRERGYLPEALLNFLVLLGWSSGKEIFSREELIAEFSLERVARSPAVFDRDKLNWVNRQYLRSADNDRMTRLSVPYLVKAGYLKEEQVPEEYPRLREIVRAVRGNLDYLAQIAEETEIFFREVIFPLAPEVEAILRNKAAPVVLKYFLAKLEAGEEFNEEKVVEILQRGQKDTGFRGQEFYFPLRVALTGKIHGPELPRVMMGLGRKRCRQRLQKALFYLREEKVNVRTEGEG